MALIEYDVYKQKLRDLGLIFGAYDALTARTAADPRDRVTRLAEALEQSAERLMEPYAVSGRFCFQGVRG